MNSDPIPQKRLLIRDFSRKRMPKQKVPLLEGLEVSAKYEQLHCNQLVDRFINDDFFEIEKRAK